ncbi:MAG: hypothetical protein A2X67_12230 [Ignavibacteria bacterium GWA2_55_11]|nr:MAG: hypothetical protein A2X67_12230 [Ignavibacteria bacterium GWA2_55_11]OGU66318.1 MAG: hypothetical protein A3C56_13825 [Ignavibacteria bacterium RIFCSPHIGHO2_02_FULL_56_12]OGU74828.1 MAG: hypothetical protein A3H45_13835 [Ignavibacteria bacterium RIFCSPLOWO2_02_FULL_55_14]OGU75860.1 MAG: hypothetical protein A3G43_09455 [Ignavibacteria bacterium RIFCSPLOWO2_12_FULL_56_21]HAV22046.1 DNA-directed RNA polymerase subunit omega [Bacteroidota bacterium]
MSIKPVDMERFYQSAGNIYEAIVVTAKRARQVHDELQLELNQRLETIKQLTQAPTTTENEEDLENVGVNPDQLKISLEFETRPKATDVALDEVNAGKVTWRVKDAPEPPKE